MFRGKEIEKCTELCFCRLEWHKWLCPSIALPLEGVCLEPGVLSSYVESVIASASKRFILPSTLQLIYSDIPGCLSRATCLSLARSLAQAFSLSFPFQCLAPSHLPLHAFFLKHLGQIAVAGCHRKAQNQRRCLSGPLRTSSQGSVAKSRFIQRCRDHHRDHQGFHFEAPFARGIEFPPQFVIAGENVPGMSLLSVKGPCTVLGSARS